MTFVVCVALAGAYVLLGVLLWDRARERDRYLAALGKPSAELQALVGLCDRLCQRIQAPAAAVAEHHDAATSGPVIQAPTPDDDESFWESQVSTVELAQLAMEQELRAREESLLAD